MPIEIKETSWLADLIKAFNELGGMANYQDVYPVAKRIRTSRGGNWTAKSDATIRRTVEDNAKDSANFRGREVFYSVQGIGKGTWGLLPEHLADDSATDAAYPLQPAYIAGIEGIVHEAKYLRKSRDPRLVEQRKLLDDFTCQVCSYRKQVGPDQYIIDVHHLNPIGDSNGIVLTSINDLTCLCPNCHRVAHSRQDRPLSMSELRTLL
ncbi:HNH endonuclease [Pseudohalocynthiibacter sp. F2068]|uniref:HNH endonuclease n=1 Tax=Pseudohalocynthiibacter sp. F2068 TaxID=2926418 RepID=UPI001FF6781B|nr:HNH endonuclease [Pseudohalocynthiibacter sp. F2068]MCK0104385.1 HNH endonuclease [Pseudohalocynthiibacter sp. F2068]